MGNGIKPLMGCASGEDGGSLALHGVYFWPSFPLTPTASSVGHYSFCSPALTGTMRTGLSLGEIVKWTETRSVLKDNKTVERLLLERENTQATHEESVKGHDTLANSSPLKSSLDPISVSLPGPEQDQPATPWVHKRGPDRRNTKLLEPL